MGFFKKIAQDPDEGPDNTKDCETCNGTGRISYGHISGNPEDTKDIECPWCHGTKRVHK